MVPLNLLEYEAAARVTLPSEVFDYIAGAAEDAVTLHANRTAFDQWRLLPRVLRGVAHIDLSTSVLGCPISMPVLIAPTAAHRLVHRDGELATAHAARCAETIFTLSTLSSCACEDISEHAGSWWFQLYILQDRDATLDLVFRAERCGASALVVTVDTPRVGRREADLRNAFTLPDAVLQAHGRLSYEPAISWLDLDWLASRTNLPIIPKGILAPDDARLAFEHGARAVIVSNHGGRQLDSTVATLDALPAVVQAVDGRGDVLMDGGIRRGVDVVKALALGARAVMLGRPILWGLATNGEAGVVQLLDLLRNELALALLLCGCVGAADVDQSLLIPRDPVRVHQGAQALG